MPSPTDDTYQHTHKHNPASIRTRRAHERWARARVGYCRVCARVCETYKMFGAAQCERALCTIAHAHALVEDGRRFGAAHGRLCRRISLFMCMIGKHARVLLSHASVCHRYTCPTAYYYMYLLYKSYCLRWHSVHRVRACVLSACTAPAILFKCVYL